MNFLEWLWGKYQETKHTQPTMPEWVRKMLQSKRFWILLAVLIIFLILARKKGFWVGLACLVIFFTLLHYFGLFTASLVLATGGILAFLFITKSERNYRRN